MDLPTTYMNCISGSRLENGKIPVTMDTDCEVLEVALKTIRAVFPVQARVARISSTLALDSMYISESLVGEVARNPRVEIVGRPDPLRFDEAGNLR